MSQALKMIRDIDIETAKKLTKHLAPLAYPHPEKEGELAAVNHEYRAMLELVDRMVELLKIAPYSYRKLSKKDKADNYWLAVCDVCKWWGSSRLLGGGGPIADTGDYGDCWCPVCGNTNI